MEAGWDIACGLGPLALILVVGVIAWSANRKKREGAGPSNDFVAMKGKASSLAGDMREDAVRKLSDPHYPKRR
jgi:hypothetical protein